MQTRMKFLFLFLTVIFYLNLASAQSSDFVLTDLTRMYLFYNSRPVNHAKEVMQDNELEKNALGENANISWNPLLLNGKVLDYDMFFLESKGVLTLVKGKPETDEATPIPFYISIRRNGKIFEDKKMTFLNKSLYKINLSALSTFTKNGDILIIKPARAEDWKAKRILKLIANGC